MKLTPIAQAIPESQAEAMIHVLGFDGHKAFMEKAPHRVRNNGVEVSMWNVRAFLPEHKSLKIVKAVRDACLT